MQSRPLHRCQTFIADRHRKDQLQNCATDREATGFGSQIPASHEDLSERSGLSTECRVYRVIPLDTSWIEPLEVIASEYLHPGEIRIQVRPLQVLPLKYAAAQFSTEINFDAYGETDRIPHRPTGPWNWVREWLLLKHSN